MSNTINVTRDFKVIITKLEIIKILKILNRTTFIAFIIYFRGTPCINIEVNRFVFTCEISQPLHRKSVMREKNEHNRLCITLLLFIFMSARCVGNIVIKIYLKKISRRKRIIIEKKK